MSLLSLLLLLILDRRLLLSLLLHHLLPQQIILRLLLRIRIPSRSNIHTLIPLHRSRVLFLRLHLLLLCLVPSCRVQRRFLLRIHAWE
jgi:hypothetical protein